MALSSRISNLIFFIESIPHFSVAGNFINLVVYPCGVPNCTDAPIYRDNNDR